MKDLAGWSVESENNQSSVSGSSGYSKGDRAVDADNGGISATGKSCPRCFCVHSAPEEVLALEKEARASGKSSYIDPESKCSVFTSRYLADKKVCCGFGCRHCPFEHIKVTWQATQRDQSSSSSSSGIVPDW